MAIYALDIKHRAKGRGAPAKAHALYIAREGRYAEKRSESHAEYLAREGKHERRAQELEATWSGNMPEWARSAKDFWEAADTYERSNGRVYTEIVVALPRELERGEREELVREFIKEEIGERFSYTAAIHNSRALDGGEQPHAHIMFSIREHDGIERGRELFFRRSNAKNPEQGGAPKSREWSKDSRENDRVGEIRESWERLANRALERAGVEARIDRRSLEAQGIDREPEPKMGPEVTQRLKRGQETEIGEKVIEIRAYKAKRQELERLEQEHREELARVYDFEKKRERRQPKNEISLEGEGLSPDPEKLFQEVQKIEYLDLHFTSHKGKEGTEYRRKTDGELAFTDLGQKITFEDTSIEAVRAGIELAEAKGWQRIEVKGTEEFRQRYFIEATARGREVTGYEATEADLRQVEELKKWFEVARELQKEPEKQNLNEEELKLGKDWLEKELQKRRGTPEKDPLKNLREEALKKQSSLDLEGEKRALQEARLEDLSEQTGKRHRFLGDLEKVEGKVVSSHVIGGENFLAFETKRGERVLVPSKDEGLSFGGKEFTLGEAIEVMRKGRSITIEREKDLKRRKDLGLGFGR